MFADIAKFVELKQNLQSCECPTEPAGPLRCIVQSASAPRTFRKGLGSALTLAQPLTRAYGVCTRARFSSQEQRLTTCVFVFCTVDCDDSTTTVTVTYPAVTVSAWTPFVAHLILISGHPCLAGLCPKVARSASRRPRWKTMTDSFACDSMRPSPPCPCTTRRPSTTTTPR